MLVGLRALGLFDGPRLVGALVAGDVVAPVVARVRRRACACARARLRAAGLVALVLVPVHRHQGDQAADGEQRDDDRTHDHRHVPAAAASAASAQDLGVPTWVGVLMILGMLACSLALSAAFLALVPARRTWFTA
ncbi:hypothetical protein GUY61_38115, partial [Streptomyces sp. GC420]|nr:hypothetical protein [Streptomyces sp. GC420]